MEIQQIVERLAELGFSHYDARAYIGLVGQEPQTGYALANRTQIPQPKVYETLRRLERRRAVIRTGSDPARFVAVPPEHLVTQLEEEYQQRLDQVRAGLSELASVEPTDGARLLESPRSWPAIREKALHLLGGAERHVYVSGSADQLDELVHALVAADARGVRCDVLWFGSTPVELSHGRVLRHSSTQGVVYRHHQARHLALVVDSVHALWALAPNGSDWDAMGGEDVLLAALVKGYVRHDVYVQQIFADFPEELAARYGPGLDGVVVRGDASPPAADTSEGPSDPGAGRRRGRRTA